MHYSEQYIVKNKIQSWRLIEELGLNTFPYILLDKFDETKLREFLESAKKTHTCDAFGFRSLKESGSKIFHFGMDTDEVMEKAKKLQHFVAYGFNTETESKKILCGEVMIDEPYYMELSATVSTDPKDTARSALCNPTTRFNGSLLHDKKIKHMVRKTPGLEEVIDFMCEKDLIGIATEFGLYSEPNGIKKENLLVFELRTDF